VDGYETTRSVRSRVELKHSSDVVVNRDYGFLCVAEAPCLTPVIEGNGWVALTSLSADVTGSATLLG
jgi:hypothetical protein